MNSDDPRHGTNRGYNAGCRDTCCKTGHAQFRKHARNRLYLERRNSLTTTTQGTLRRLEALMALGWSTRQLDTLLDRQPTYTANLMLRCTTDPTRLIYLTTHQQIAALYDRLSMTLPPTDTAERRQIVTRTRNLAARRGYAPPLAYDDIDTDTAPTRGPRHSPDWDTTVDDVMVQRAVNRHPKGRRLTSAEAAEAVRRLRARGLSTTQIEAYGLKPERYGRAAS